MITHKLEKLPKNTHEITVSIPWEEVQKNYALAFDHLHTELAIEGYRKGKVPKPLAEKHLKKEDIYNQLVKTMLPRIYEEIVKKEGLKPIVSPKVDLISAKENEDWEVKIKLAEKPEVDLGDYKTYIKEAKNAAKTPEIWVPGKEGEEKPKEEEKGHNQLNAVLEALIKNTKCEISDIIIEDELETRLTRLLDDIQRLGLTVDAYLKSKNLTIDDMRAQIAKEIEDTYKIEFILMEVAEKEKINVEKEDLDKLFGSIQEVKDRQAAEQNAYFYASILRKQKTLDFLTNL